MCVAIWPSRSIPADHSASITRTGYEAMLGVRLAKTFESEKAASPDIGTTALKHSQISNYYAGYAMTK